MLSCCLFSLFCRLESLSLLVFPLVLQLIGKIRRGNHKYLGTRLNKLKMGTRPFFTWPSVSPISGIKTQWLLLEIWWKGKEILHLIIFNKFPKSSLLHLFCIKNPKCYFSKAHTFPEGTGKLWKIGIQCLNIKILISIFKWWW